MLPDCFNTRAMPFCPHRKDIRVKINNEAYHSLFARDDVIDIPPRDALKHIAMLIDASAHLIKREGLEKAIELTASLNQKILTPEQMFELEYFTANAWAGLRRIRSLTEKKHYHWENDCAEKEIFHFRKALLLREHASKLRVCQTLTNLGNLMNHLGRPIDAFGYWDEACRLDPKFAMARGNKAYGLSFHARWVQNKRQQHIIWRYAYDELGEALKGHLEGDAYQGFNRVRETIRKAVSPVSLKDKIDWGKFSGECSDEERHYREWCLRHRLFLNPLNDIGPYPIASSDSLTLPDIVVKLHDDMRYTAFMNQMKQEYVSARFFLYEGMLTKKPHFSDRAVLLFNTLDFPSYSLSTEQVKTAFRILYSVFDKVAFFLNDYLQLKIPHENVSFRRIWYKAQKREKGLRPDITSRNNWGLHGLFWLGKDLFENVPGFREVIEPEARALDSVRNHVEHRYLKLHQDMWLGPRQIPSWDTDSLAHSMYRHEFESKTLKLGKLARSALACLYITVAQEEASKAKTRKASENVLPVFIDQWDDRWKV